MNDRGKEIFGLHKVPDEELLRLARIELGKSNSYILELEHKIDEMASELQLIKNGEISYKDITLTDRESERLLKKRIENQSKELARLNESIFRIKNNQDSLKHDPNEYIRIEEYTKLKEKNQKLTDEVVKLNKLNHVLQSQLVDLSKK